MSPSSLSLDSCKQMTEASWLERVGQWPYIRGVKPLYWEKNLDLSGLYKDIYLVNTVVAGLRLEIFSPWSYGKEFCPQNLVYGFLTLCSELLFVFGSLPPSTQDVEHTLTVVFSWSEIWSVHWNSTGNWRQRRSQRPFVNNWLTATAAKGLGVIPNWVICLLFINVLTPSHIALSLPRSDDSLNF